MVMAREEFMAPEDHRWGVLKYRSDDLLKPSIPTDEAEIDLTNLTKTQPLTSSTKIEEVHNPVPISTE